MTKYVKVDEFGDVICVIDSKTDQKGFLQFEIPPRPDNFKSNMVFNINSKSWVEKKLPDSYLIINIKQKRQSLLSASDWTDLLSSYDRLGEVKYSEWQTYRQALRDITSQPGYPTDVKWPTAPA